MDKEIIKLLKEKELPEFTSIIELHDYILKNHNIYIEVFYSIFKKLWTVNNYFVNTKNSKRVNWEYEEKYFVTRDEALEFGIKNYLKL